MSEYKFIKTKDSSYGLFNTQINDIYHAREGAFTEALDKFSKPAIVFLNDNITLQNKCINLSDICYGIGYNTITFLNLFLNKNHNFNKLNVNCFELNKELIMLSPFIKGEHCNFILRIFLIKNLLKYISKSQIDNVLKSNLEHLDMTTYKHFKGQLYFVNSLRDYKSAKVLFLHNTYYNYMSKRHNSALKVNKLRDITLRYYIGDARKTINDLMNKQNIVFLDAFDPKKLPTLWSQEFFNVISSKMDDNFSMLFTYSHAASVRSAMLNANLFVGKNKEIGTVATKNIILIKQHLTDYEKGLLNTNAGVPYRDYNLCMDASQIIQDRLRRVKLENRESSTHYAKNHQK